MTLLNRAARLLRADLHAVFDVLEDPQSLLSDALRDMEAAQAVQSQQLTVASDDLERWRKSLRTTEAELSRLGDELEVCLQADDDELARGVVRKQLAKRRQLADTRARVEEQQTHCDALRATCEAQAEKIAQVRDKLNLVSAPVDEPAGSVTVITEADVEVALLAEKQARSAR